MKFNINTLKRAMCAVIAAVVLLLGVWTPAEAQRRRNGSYNGYRNYGQWRRTQNIDRRYAVRDLRRRQRHERYVIRDRWSNGRGNFDNNRNWRDRRKDERKELKRHQRAERQLLKERFKSRRRGY